MRGAVAACGGAAARRWLGCVLVFSCVLFVSGVARAQRLGSVERNTRVVLVRTRGPLGWVAAERRLAAELMALRMIVVNEPIVRQVDDSLPEHAMRYRAFAAVQVMRKGDRGVIRMWFADQADPSDSGFQHLELNLRNADVVSRAVLPTVETIVGRSQMSDADPVEPTLPTNDGDPLSHCEQDNDACDPLLSLRLGAGPWMVTASEGTAFSAIIGAHVRLGSRWSLDPELSYQVLAQQNNAATISGLFVLRSHAMLDVWSGAGGGLGVGLGAGVVKATSNQSSLDYHPLASTRALLFARASERLDVVLAASGARAFGAQGAVPNNGWFADVMLAVDWHVWM